MQQIIIVENYYEMIGDNKKWEKRKLFTDIYKATNNYTERIMSISSLSTTAIIFVVLQIRE